MPVSGLLHQVPKNDFPIYSQAPDRESEKCPFGIHWLGPVCSCSEAAHVLVNTRGFSVINHSLKYRPVRPRLEHKCKAPTGSCNWLLTAGQAAAQATTRAPAHCSQKLPVLPLTSRVASTCTAASITIATDACIHMWLYVTNGSMCKASCAQQHYDARTAMSSKAFAKQKLLSMLPTRLHLDTVAVHMKSHMRAGRPDQILS